jgi:hypothetical protein
MDYIDHSYRNVNLGLFSNQVIEIDLNLYALENIITTDSLHGNQNNVIQ